MKYKGFLLFFLVMLSISLKSQIDFDLKINTGINYSELSKPKFDIEGDYVYIYDESFQSFLNNQDGIIIYREALDGRDSSFITIPVPNFPAMISDPLPLDIQVSGSSLIILFSKSFILYDIERKELRCIQPQSQSYNYLLEGSNDSIIYFAKNYNHHNYDQRIKCMVSAYNVHQLRFVPNGNFIPEYSGIGFTHFGVNRWFAALDTFIVFAQTLEQQIHFYNRQGDLVRIFDLPKDSIEVVNNISVHDSIMAAYNGNAKQLIQFLLPYNKDFERIDRIYAINDSTLLIFRIPPKIGNKKVRNIDLLITQGTEFTYRRNFWSDKEPSPVENLNTSQYPMFSFFDNDIKPERQALYSLYPDIPMEILGKNYGKVKILRKSYLLKGSPTYQMTKHNISVK